MAQREILRGKDGVVVVPGTARTLILGRKWGLSIPIARQHEAKEVLYDLGRLFLGHVALSHSRA